MNGFMSLGQRAGSEARQVIRELLSKDEVGTDQSTYFISLSLSLSLSPGMCRLYLPIGYHGRLSSVVVSGTHIGFIGRQDSRDLMIVGEIL